MAAISESLRYISEKSDLCNYGECLSFHQLKSIRDKCKPDGLQHHLSSHMDLVVKKEFSDSLDAKHLAWYNSVSCNMTSRFLNVLPKCNAFTFDSNEFTTILSHRLYLPQPEWSLGLRCNCNRTIQGIREHPLLYERVHNAITNCPKEGVGIKLHHEMSNTLKDLANACGIRAQREEVNCFQSILNNVHFTDKEKRYRPDLSLFDMPGSHRKVIFDISSIPCPIPILGQ